MGVGLSDEENRKQFAGIVVPHLSEAFAVASWLTGNRTDAEDVVQEAASAPFVPSAASPASMLGRGC